MIAKQDTQLLKNKLIEFSNLFKTNKYHALNVLIATNQVDINGVFDAHNVPKRAYVGSEADVKDAHQKQVEFDVLHLVDAREFFKKGKIQKYGLQDSIEKNGIIAFSKVAEIIEDIITTNGNNIDQIINDLADFIENDDYFDNYMQALQSLSFPSQQNKFTNLNYDNPTLKNAFVAPYQNMCKMELILKELQKEYNKGDDQDPKVNQKLTSLINKISCMTKSLNGSVMASDIPQLQEMIVNHINAKSKHHFFEKDRTLKIMPLYDLITRLHGAKPDENGQIDLPKIIKDWEENEGKQITSSKKMTSTKLLIDDLKNFNRPVCLLELSKNEMEDEENSLTNSM